jgi:hypothetical protein
MLKPSRSPMKPPSGCTLRARSSMASPWLVVLEKCQRAVVALSMRLRLSPQSRLDPKTLARQAPPGPKPWDDLK